MYVLQVVSTLTGDYYVIGLLSLLLVKTMNICHYFVSLQCVLMEQHAVALS